MAKIEQRLYFSHETISLEIGSLDLCTNSRISLAISLLFPPSHYHILSVWFGHKTTFQAGARRKAEDYRDRPTSIANSIRKKTHGAFPAVLLRDFC